MSGIKEMNDMKDRIKEINEQIKALRQDMVDKVNKLIEERDKLINEQNPPFLNPYGKYKDLEDNEYVFKIIEPYHDYDTGEIFGYQCKVIAIKGIPFYHSNYFLRLENIKEWKFISEVEFEESLAKSFALIRKDII